MVEANYTCKICRKSLKQTSWNGKPMFVCMDYTCSAYRNPVSPNPPLKVVVPESILTGEKYDTSNRF